MALERKLKIIEILWDGPHTFKKVKKFNDLRKDRGLYQIYGAHEVYGPCSLLYIGKTSKQSFRERIPYQKKWMADDQEYRELQVYLGRLGGVQQVTEIEWEKLIDDAEKLLLYWACPVYNEQGCEDTSIEGIKGTVVVNLGRKMNLPVEVSTLSNESKHYDKSSKWKVFDGN